MTRIRQTEKPGEQRKRATHLTIRSEVCAGAVYTPTQLGNPCPCRLYGKDPNTGVTRCLWRAC